MNLTTKEKLSKSQRYRETIASNLEWFRCGHAMPGVTFKTLNRDEATLSVLLDEFRHMLAVGPKAEGGVIGDEVVALSQLRDRVRVFASTLMLGGG